MIVERITVIRYGSRWISLGAASYVECKPECDLPIIHKCGDGSEMISVQTGKPVIEEEIYNSPSVLCGGRDS